MSAPQSGQTLEALLTTEAEIWATSGSEGGAKSDALSAGGLSSEALRPIAESSSGPMPGAGGVGSSTGGSGGWFPSGAIEPSAVLRHPMLRSEWQRRVGAKERISWRGFWYKLVQPQVRGVSTVVATVHYAGCSFQGRAVRHLTGCGHILWPPPAVHTAAVAQAADASPGGQALNV
jgi:hypothetical protein